MNISARIIPAKSGSEAALTHSVSAAAAGAIATLATHPFDVIKVNIYLDRGVHRLTQNITADEGPGTHGGAVPRVLQDDRHGLEGKRHSSFLLLVNLPLTAHTAARCGGLLRWRVAAPLAQGAQLGDWLGGVRRGAHVHADGVASARLDRDVRPGARAYLLAMLADTA